MVRSYFWLGLLAGIMSATLIVLWQISKDKKGPGSKYYYAGLIHKWVWLWVLLLLFAVILWTADIIPGSWVWGAFFGLLAFVFWAFVLSIFRPTIAGLMIWGDEKVEQI